MSAVHVAAALGARPIAVDVRPEPLERARELEAAETIDATAVHDVAQEIVGERLSLEDVPETLSAMDEYRTVGIPVVTQF
ncbi:hypothetical protein FYC77_14015 [Natrialba swarupiae]|uniref:Zinc-binding dehydrogenase n=1 Tax=Natrialba swarupiae TaxID=2448032 RepID=A0A5D5AK32_9EURY|nr:hypothetical protein [Natrialba swarupiae]TYT61375.1 hypothetical protein FYC77_14015 [Natrialba swarupiae]